MTLKQDLELALEALKLTVGASADVRAFDLRIEAISALEARLENWTDEPVGWLHTYRTGFTSAYMTPLSDSDKATGWVLEEPLYPHPAEPVIPEGWKLVPI